MGGTRTLSGGGRFGFECLILGGIGTVDVGCDWRCVSAPTGTGTTAPPAGPPAFTEEVLNSIVAIRATPNTGYCFVNWSGEGVTDVISPSTNVTMDQAKTDHGELRIDYF